MGFKRFLTLIEQDFFDFFAGKSWIILLVLPLFITFLYTVIYPQTEARVYIIAYHGTLPRPIRQVFNSSHLKLRSFADLKLAKKALTNGKVDGLLLNNSPGDFKLMVDKTKAKEITFIVDAVNLALLKVYSPGNIPLVKLIYLNKAVPTRWISLPIWLLQIILTICLLQAAAAIADEKERQTLHSLLVSPLTLTNYLLAKIFWHSLIGTGAIWLTLVLVRPTINLLMVLVFGFLGCLSYSVISLLIGLFTPTALFARSLATLTYIISALPLMIKDLTFNWKGILNIFPSYMVLYGLERALTFNPINSSFVWYSAGLTAEIGLIFSITYWSLKYKADF